MNNAATPVETPLIERDKAELIRIIERLRENLSWYVRERNQIAATTPSSVSREPISAEQWALQAAEEIYLLYRDSNYFRSMPKEPLIAGWAEIIARAAARTCETKEK